LNFNNHFSGPRAALGRVRVSVCVLIKLNDL